MAAQLMWKDEALFDEIRRNNRALFHEYPKVTPFVRKLDVVPNWLHVYKKVTYYPSWYNDFRKFHKDIRSEVLKILGKKSKLFRPLRFNLEFVMKSEKYT